MERTDEKINRLYVWEKEFGEERIRKSLERMTAGSKKQKGKFSLEKWFG